MNLPHFVEDDQVERLGRSQIDRVVAVVARNHVVALALKKQNVRLKQVDLVVDPQDFGCTHRFTDFISYKDTKIRHMRRAARRMPFTNNAKTGLLLSEAAD